MRKLLKNTRFRTKIVVIFIGILLIDTLLIGSLFYIYTNQDILSNYQTSSEELVAQINLHLTDKLNMITQKVNALGSNLSFTEPMGIFLRNNDNSSQATLAGNVADMITELKMGDELIGSVYIYTSKGLFDDYLFVRDRRVLFEDTPVYAYLNQFPEKRILWMPAVENTLYLNAERVIPVLYRLKAGGQDIYLVVNISQKKLGNYLRQTYHSFERIFIVDHDGEEIVNYQEGDEELILQFQEEDILENNAISKKSKMDGNWCLVTYSELKGSMWRICAITSIRSLTQNVRQLQIFVIALALVSMILGTEAVLLLTNRLMKPLEQIAGIMEDTVDQDFQVEFKYPYNDEIGFLGKSYLSMVREIAELVSDLNAHIEALQEEKENVKRVQMQKRKAELLALQAQINPHFLYNTLNAITWQAVEQGAEEISEISSALGRYFRISLSKGREIITVEEELSHARSYLEIQKIRYKNKLDYQFLIEEGVERFYTIKLILQPLVENALYHGIKPKETGGEIMVCAELISVKEKLYIRFRVIDGGCGILQEERELLNNRLRAGVIDSNSGYGIYNVNERIRLYYGKEYGLFLDENQPQGTVATIVIPCDTQKGAEKL